MRRTAHTSFNWLADDLNDAAMARMLPYCRGRVVDLGCGRAAFKKDVLAVADEYIGVDWAASQHDLSQVDVFADLTRPLPFPDSSVDTVLGLQVMEHLPEPSSFLSECRRILRPEGSLLLTTPFMWWIHEPPRDYYRYTVFGLKHLLRTAGFVDIATWEHGGFWQMMALKFNYHTVRYANGVPRPFRYPFVPLWWATQRLAPVFDRWDAGYGETVGYTAIARKPTATKP